MCSHAFIIRLTEINCHVLDGRISYSENCIKIRNVTMKFGTNLKLEDEFLVSPIRSSLLTKGIKIISLLNVMFHIT